MPKELVNVNYLRVMKIDFWALLFHTRFKMTSATAAYRVVVCVKISEDDKVGLGAGVLYGSNPRHALRQIKEVRQAILQSGDLSLESIELLMKQFSGRIDGGVLYAVELSVIDFISKRKACSAAELFGGAREKKFKVTEQIWAESETDLESALEPILARGTSSLKIKLPLGKTDLAGYLKRISEICGPKIELKVDVNRPKLSEADTIDLARKLRNQGITVVEDLVDIRTWVRWNELKAAAGDMGLMIDSGVDNVDSLKSVLTSAYFDILNIKLSRVGGIMNGRKLAALCEEAGKRVSVGCCEDLGPAMKGIVCFAAVCPVLAGVEGIGKHRLKVDLIENEVEIKDGELNYDDRVVGLQEASTFIFPDMVPRIRIGRRNLNFELNGVFARGRSFLLNARHRFCYSH